MKQAGRIQLRSYDELFNGGYSEETTEGKIIRVPLSRLHAFKEHPFRVVDDDKMMETVESIKKYGVLVPAIVRKDGDGGYELISGHRRKRGSELAGKEDMPVIIKELSDDEATIIMVDSNIQREDILPSEKAKAYRMKLEALKHQGVKGERYTADLVGDAAGDSGRTVQRYIRLTYLISELLELADMNKLSLVAGEKLSFLHQHEQEWVLQLVKNYNIGVSREQAELLKCESEKRILNEARVLEILVKPKRREGISIPEKRIRDYFPKEYTKKQIEEVIFRLLDSWKKEQD